MTKRAVGPGGACCDGAGCDLCKVSPAVPAAPVPVVVEDDFDLFDEEDDE